MDPVLEEYIDKSSLRQFQFQLVSCNCYGADVIQNLANSTFYEKLLDLIESNNIKKILPNIQGIESIKCLNNGGVEATDVNTARYSIQMQIIYFKERNE